MFRVIRRTAAINIRSIGKKEPIKEDYKFGQYFIHNEFDYKGIVLYSEREKCFTFNDKTNDYHQPTEETRLVTLVDMEDIRGREHMFRDVIHQ